MDINSIKARLWLCIPVIITDILDATVTMLGQSAEYWQGSYHLVNEANPIACWFLEIHPLANAVYIILDFGVISILIILLPLFFAKILAAYWTVGSAKAIYGWSYNRLGLGWWGSNLVILFPIIILVYAFEKAMKYEANQEKQTKAPHSG